ncbi:MAG: ABC-three component system middle component 6 [Bacteroidota bacterium]
MISPSRHVLMSESFPNLDATLYDAFYKEREVAEKNEKLMILPSKHIRVSESLMGLGGIILDFLQKGEKTVDELWLKISKINNSKRLPAYHSFDNVVFSLNYLFAIGAVDIGELDKIYIIKKENNK